jgi:uncharacterized membrane protein YeiB
VTRVLGVDVARGAALIGMMAAHSFDVVDDQGAPSAATVITAGRSVAAFVLIAGVSLAFMSGGRQVVQGRARTGVAAGLVVRAVLIGVIGLALGMLAELNGVEGILPFYAVLFLLAVPLIGCPPLALAGVAGAVVVAGPVLLIATAGTALAGAGTDRDPSFAGLVADPLGVLVQLFVTGEYPVLVYLAYICAGLAIGRLELGSRRVAWWLFGGGIALAAVVQLVSALLLHPLGGLAALISADPFGTAPADTTSQLLWNPGSPVASWWYLAVPAPHSHSTIDLAHTLGSAIAVLGAALLLTRARVMARVLSPLAAAGAMVLTLYAAHLIVLATGVLADRPGSLLLVMVVSALVFAVLWRRWIGQGPLERIVAVISGAGRRVVDRLTHDSTTVTTDGRRGARGQRPTARASQFLLPIGCALALVLAFAAGTRYGPDLPGLVVAEDEPGAAAPAGPPGPATDEGVSSEPGPDEGRPPARPPEAAGARNLDRYCRLSEQVGDLEDRFPECPRAFVEAAEPQLADMARVAPAAIQDAVAVSVDDIRADAREPGKPSDPADLEQAEGAIDAFEEQYCT